MKAQIILGNDGSLMISVDQDGSTDFETARRKIEQLKAILGDLPIQFEGDVERHVHGPQGQHVRATAKT